MLNFGSRGMRKQKKLYLKFFVLIYSPSCEKLVPSSCQRLHGIFIERRPSNLSIVTKMVDDTRENWSHVTKYK